MRSLVILQYGSGVQAEAFHGLVLTLYSSLFNRGDWYYRRYLHLMSFFFFQIRHAIEKLKRRQWQIAWLWRGRRWQRRQFGSQLPPREVSNSLFISNTWGGSRIVSSPQGHFWQDAATTNFKSSFHRTFAVFYFVLCMYGKHESSLLTVTRNLFQPAHIAGKVRSTRPARSRVLTSRRLLHRVSHTLLRLELLSAAGAARLLRWWGKVGISSGSQAAGKRTVNG